MKTIIKKLRRDCMKTTTVLSLILMLVFLAGCGGSSEASNPVSKSQQTTPEAELVSEQDNVSVQQDTTQEDTVQEDTAQQDTTQENTTQEDTAQQDTTQEDTAQQSTTESGGIATDNQDAPTPETDPQAAAENPTPVKQDETVAEFIRQGKVSAEWVTSSVLTNDYPDGANIRNQLAWGTLQLEDDPELAITSDQAGQMLRSWRRLNKLVWGGSCSQTEQELLTEIESMMTPEQLQAIVAMKITRQDIKDIAVEWGLDPTMAGKVLSDQELKELRTAKASSNQIGVGMELTRRVVELVIVRANS
jgi:DNA mismatch repair ATPase MutL